MQEITREAMDDIRTAPIFVISREPVDWLLFFVPFVGYASRIKQ